MATGTGKTLTSSAIIKMFLRLYNVKRVLFLVDRIELESQAQKEFDEVLKNDFRTVFGKRTNLIGRRQRLSFQLFSHL